MELQEYKDKMVVVGDVDIWLDKEKAFKLAYGIKNDIRTVSISGNIINTFNISILTPKDYLNRCLQRKKSWVDENGNVRDWQDILDIKEAEELKEISKKQSEFIAKSKKLSEEDLKALEDWEKRTKSEQNKSGQDDDRAR